jgi:hypothetical protein
MTSHHTRAVRTHSRNKEREPNQPLASAVVVVQCTPLFTGTYPATTPPTRRATPVSFPRLGFVPPGSGRRADTRARRSRAVVVTRVASSRRRGGCRCMHVEWLVGVELRTL